METTQKMRRPAATERRAAILDAAAEVFLEQGFAAASIDAIIEKVGGSKRNIYSLFGSKEGLFIALVSDESERLFNLLSAEKPARQRLDETLYEFAVLLLNIFMSPRMVGVYRVVVSEAGRLPELAAAFYRNGPDRGAEWLSRVLRDAELRGEIAIVDAKRAAQWFLGILRGNIYMEVVLGLREAMRGEEIDRTARAAVHQFLYGVCSECSAPASGGAGRG